MKTIAVDLVEKLINKGIDTFFGVQGGACARLVEAVIKLGGKFYPVLNEQAAGYCAHGYYLARRKPAGVIVTTGPGFTNSISGIAACYYDNIPLIVLVGQVKKSLNIANNFGTKMVGFQELPHLKIGEKISDKVFCIDSKSNYKKFSKKLLPEICKKVSIVEVLDDVQRYEIDFSLKNKKTKNKKERKLKFSKQFIKEINKTYKTVFLIGGGFARSVKLNKNLDLLNKLNIPVGFSWGGQEISRKVKKNIGIFGDHTPGSASEYVENCEIIIGLGISLLQHQVGKEHKNFAPNAKIVFVNNNINECKRAKEQFGKRLIYFNTTLNNFLLSFKKIYDFKLNYKKIKFHISSKSNNKQNALVETLKLIIQKIDEKNSLIFSDAGATLSWSYQAANLIKSCAPIYTAFNLHPMGYANCAAVGAACSSAKNIFVIIGDGSIPMNSQELSWAKKSKIKFIIIDNKGYGVIRQTQMQFYDSFFLGSDFLNKKSHLPHFSVKKIFKSYDIKTMEFKSKSINKKKLRKFFNQKNSSALIIDTKYSETINTYKK